MLSTSAASVSNIFINNSVYSNGNIGINISLNCSNYNAIVSNKIWGHPAEGIALSGSDYYEIYRNRIYRNNVGIGVYSGASNIKIINNTIFGSGADGVFWNSTSCGTMYNNIILSNGDIAGEYGIDNAGSGDVYAAYNDIFGLQTAFTNSGSGTLTLGPGNIYTDPMIETVTSFTIISASSPAVDNGIEYPPITDGWQKGGPDMGWKESAYSNQGSMLVHNISIPQDYFTITLALADASNGHQIQVDPGVYN